MCRSALGGLELEPQPPHAEDAGKEVVEDRDDEEKRVHEDHVEDREEQRRDEPHGGAHPHQVHVRDDDEAHHPPEEAEEPADGGDDRPGRHEDGEAGDRAPDQRDREALGRVADHSADGADRHPRRDHRVREPEGIDALQLIAHWPLLNRAYGRKRLTELSSKRKGRKLLTCVPPRDWR
jgi:hypothetical protein